MKKHVLFFSNIFYLRFFLLFNFIIKKYKSQHPAYFKILYITDNKYYYINTNKIYFYSLSTPNKIWDFTSKQAVNTEEDAEKINLGIYKNNNDIEDLIVVKNYVYAVKELTYYCNTMINEINGYSAQIFPFKCINSQCWFLIGIINSSNKICLYLYRNIPERCSTTFITSFNINNVGSEKFSCQFIHSPSNEEILTCFYQNKIQMKFLQII